MARLPEVWGEDAEEYNPSRFLSKNEDGEWQYTTPSQWIFHVFNAGQYLFFEVEGTRAEKKSCGFLTFLKFPNLFK